MSEEIGPGAGRTAAPEISVITERIAALDRHFTSEFNGLKELLRSQRSADQLAIKTALDSATELAARHNDLIRQMERKDSTYATKEEAEAITTARNAEIARLTSFQNKLAGGLGAVALVGVTNLVKLWFT